MSTDQHEHDEAHVEHEHHDDAHADEHAHDHDDHGHPAEDPRWVLVPLLVGLVIGVIVLLALGIAPDVPEFG